jgi:CPA1 family monovalent cation:H+ antiporter
MLIESESLLNDGTAAVAFVAVLGVLAGGHETVLSISGWLLVTIIGGVLIGATIAYLLMLLAGRTPDYLVEITFTTLAAYGSFFVAEHYRCSGVLAALTAGLGVGNFRSSGSISAAGRHALGPFWEYVAFVANSLIFLLIGAQEAQHFEGLWVPVIVGIVLVTLGRAVGSTPLCAVFARSRLKVGPSASTRALLGRAAGCFGARARLVSTGRFAPSQCHYCDYLCCRGLLGVRSGIDDHAAAPCHGTNQIAVCKKAILESLRD